MPALTQFLGSGAGLSAPVITRLTETWKAEAAAFIAMANLTSGGLCPELPRR